MDFWVPWLLFLSFFLSYELKLNGVRFNFLLLSMYVFIDIIFFFIILGGIYELFCQNPWILYLCYAVYVVQN